MSIDEIRARLVVEMLERADAAIAALACTEPEEATEKMRRAGAEVLIRTVSSEYEAAMAVANAVYRAMLDAARRT